MNSCTYDQIRSCPYRNASGRPPSFSVLRSFKLGAFHIGSSMTDVLLSGIWNRVMIADLGMAAWPVSLLLATRYFLAPLAIWAGTSPTHTRFSAAGAPPTSGWAG